MLRWRWRRARGSPASRALPGLPYPSWLEYPRPEDPEPVNAILVRGYVAVPSRARLGQPWIVAGGARIETEREPRPEVRRGHRNRQVLGFRRFVHLTPECVGSPWELEVTVNDKAYRSPLGVAPQPRALEQFWNAKARRLERLEPLLRCPRLLPSAPTACGGVLDRDGDALVCEHCGSRYDTSKLAFDFLNEDLRQLASVEDTSNISSWGYDPLAVRMIEQCADGLVLDAGSGMKGGLYDNVVNLEIVDYPSTDVLGVGESLPFADATFDGALSLSVLEHVRDPFRCAAELARVVRPGGQVYVAVPFLQPYHGFPHHYYNMTLTGLENLLEPWFAIEESGTPPYGWPIWTLTWFLRSYAKGLPPEVAERFMQMRVADLLHDGEQYLADDFVQQLSADATTELASGNYLLGVRR